MPNSKACKHKKIQCPQINGYLRLVETKKYNACKNQLKFAKYVRRVFAEEELFIDVNRIDRYQKYLKYFPFEQFFPWEWCLFVLFTCVFTPDGLPRWSDLVCFVGRGAGKNGFISFIAFCLTTIVNGIKNYDVDICANSEEQAKRSFVDIWEMLEGENRLIFKKGFSWNRTEITNISTGSKIKYRTNSPKSKDGMRSGLVVFDEVHAYSDWKNVAVFTTGQGKCAHPRRLFSSSNGDVRDGVYESLAEKCRKILDGEIEDNGYLPFICCLDDEGEVHEPKNWEKANPSLAYLPLLRQQIEKEYKDWVENPVGNSDFMTKRMGIPQGDKIYEVTSWENLMRASIPPPDLAGRSCVLGLDFARKDDFIGAFLLFRDKKGDDEQFYGIHHSWVCARSRFLSRIKPPLDEWAQKGILTFVDDVEISTATIAAWIRSCQEMYDIRAVAVDDYRYDIVKEMLESLGFDAKKDTIVRVRPTNHMRVQPVISSAFVTGCIAWGDDPMMRWYTNNTQVVPFLNGNFKYEKIEPRGRKTDGFMAMVAAFCVRDQIPEDHDYVYLPILTF